MNWTPEPFWQGWYSQSEIVALMAPEPEPDPVLRQVAEALTQALTGRTQQAAGQALGALRHGSKHWKRWR
jgi:hypothetical protein